MGSTEKDFSRRVSAALKQAGCAVYPVETGSTGSGFPDLVVVHKGGASFVELKRRGGILLRCLAESPIEGPGQKSFARRLARQSRVSSGGVSLGERSFLLVECMDGVALMVEEEKGAYLAACWEDLPLGEDLRDAFRAWRVCAMPTEAMLEESVEECYRECALVYGRATGIRLSVNGVKEGELSLKGAGGRDKALAIARDICDRGRIALLMEIMRAEKGVRYAAPIEGGEGYVILSNGG